MNCGTHFNAEKKLDFVCVCVRVSPPPSPPIPPSLSNSNPTDCRFSRRLRPKREREREGGRGRQKNSIYNLSKPLLQKSDKPSHNNTSSIRGWVWGQGGKRLVDSLTTSSDKEIECKIKKNKLEGGYKLTDQREGFRRRVQQKSTP